MPDDILVYHENCGSAPWGTPYVSALINLGWGYVAASDEADFRNKLLGQSWDIVVYVRYFYYSSTSTFDAMYTHVASGGSLIYSNWYQNASHALFSAMDVSIGSSYTSPKTIYRWDASHPLFTTPNAVGSSLSTTYDPCNADGFYLTNSGGTAPAGYTTSPTGGQAAVIVNAAETTIFMGEIPFVFTEATLVDFLENQLVLVQ